MKPDARISYQDVSSDPRDVEIASLKNELATLRDSYDNLRRSKTSLLNEYEALVSQMAEAETPT